MEGTLKYVFIIIIVCVHMLWVWVFRDQKTIFRD